MEAPDGHGRELYGVLASVAQRGEHVEDRDDVAQDLAGSGRRRVSREGQGLRGAGAARVRGVRCGHGEASHRSLLNHRRVAAAQVAAAGRSQPYVQEKGPTAFGHQALDIRRRLPA